MFDQLDLKKSDMERFKNKICIVTGAGQGIGRAVAHRIGDEGGVVVLADIAEKPAQAVQKELQTKAVSAKVITCDLSKYEQAEYLMKETVETFGRIDVLINNVGGTIWIKPFVHYTEEQCRLELERSFWTAMWSCHAVLPYMLQRKSGSIVNIGSTSPRGIYRVPYAAAKGGVFALTTSLSREVAKEGIRVNCVAPGATEIGQRPTPRNPYEPQLTAQEEMWVQELHQYFKFQYPMGRWGTEEEQAAAIAFMASDDASYITGQILTVGGGESVH